MPTPGTEHVQVAATKQLSAGPGRLAPARIRVSGTDIPYAGGRAPTTVDAYDVEGLGAATLIVGYDPSILEATSCVRGSEFDFGLCNMEYDRDDDGTADSVRFNVVSIGGVSSSSDVPLNLVTIVFEGIGGAGARSAIELEVITFTDTDGKPIQSAAENGRVEIGHAPSPTPGPSPTPSGTAGPSPTPGPSHTPSPGDYLAYLPSLSRP
jgi:hypothetical protein